MLDDPVSEQESQVTLDRFIPYRLNNLAQRVSQALSRIYSSEFNVSVPEWRILATLAENPKLLAKEIGQQTHMDKVKVSRAVSALDSKGCLTKQRDENDSRAIRLALNAAGIRLYQQIAEKALQWEERLLVDLSQAQQEQLYDLLNYLDARVSRMAGKG